jgi:hypothetical protein
MSGAGFSKRHILKRLDKVIADLDFTEVHDAACQAAVQERLIEVIKELGTLRDAIAFHWRHE